MKNICLGGAEGRRNAVLRLLLHELYFPLSEMGEGILLRSSESYFGFSQLFLQFSTAEVSF